MSTPAKSKYSLGENCPTLCAAIGVLVLAATFFGFWATRDGNWERAWKERVRVETPLGAEKTYVLSWLDENSESIPHVDVTCEDTLQDIPIMRLAGIHESEVSSYSRTTVFRKDLFAGQRDHMRIYHFFGSDDKVVGHFYLPFHELASFERSHRLLASR